MKHIAAVVMFFSLSACSDSDEYTLYRNSVLDPAQRIHVASFNSSESGEYNQMNCNLGAELFQKQPAVLTKFWCEKGKFKK